MCPACYINGLLFLIFGASGAAVANSPWIIALSVILTIGGLYWLWQGYRKGSDGAAWKKNLKTTMLFLLVFLAGYGTAAFQTHTYFENKHQHHK
jgi:phosphatidylglycerophosphate synthase